MGELAVATRAPESSGFGRPEIVTPKDDHPGDGPALAANDRGDAVVAWDAGGVGAASFMRGSFRAGLGAFGPARRLTPGAGHFPSVAVRADGGMVIAWARNGRTASARLRTPTGSLQRPYTLTRNHEENTTVIALARGGGAVAWLHREPPRSMLRVASFGGDGRVGRPKTILRIRESWDLPDPLAFLDVPRGLYFVRGPSRDAARPLRLIRVS